MDDLPFVNDNTLIPFEFSDPNYPAFKVIATPKCLEWHIPQSQLLDWQALFSMKAVPPITTPFGELLEIVYEGTQIRIRKSSGQAFSYEEVKPLCLATLIENRLSSDVVHQLLNRAKQYFPLYATYLNPLKESSLQEITVAHGVHLYFWFGMENIAVNEYQKGMFYTALLQHMESYAPSIKLSISQQEIHFTGDDINRNACESILRFCYEHQLITSETYELLVETLLCWQIKEVALRELKVFEMQASLEEKHEMSYFKEIFMTLSMHGEFEQLSKEALEWLHGLYINRREIYQLPSVYRIPLRSLYISFHTEIYEALLNLETPSS